MVSGDQVDDVLGEVDGVVGEAVATGHRPGGLAAHLFSGPARCWERDLLPGMTITEPGDGDGPPVLHIREVVDLFKQSGNDDDEGMVQVRGVCALTGDTYTYRIHGDRQAALFTSELASLIGVNRTDSGRSDHHDLGGGCPR